MPDTSTTVVDNPDDAVNATVTDPTATDTKTASDSNNLDASKSDDTTVADDDKKSDTTDKTDDTPASTFDADLDQWIEKRNLPKPANDAQRQALQNQRNEQRDFTRERQAKKDSNALATTVADAKKEVTATDDDDNDDELEKTVKELKLDRDAERTTRLQSEFYTSNKVTPEQSKAIIDIFKEQTSQGSTPEEKKADVEYWSNPKRLPMLLKLAKAQLAEGADTTVIADEAAQKERERIERESQASGPRGAATTGGDTTEKSPDQAQLERFKARYNKT